jgi:hypothetical protein
MDEKSGGGNISRLCKGPGALWNGSRVGLVKKGVGLRCQKVEGQRCQKGEGRESKGGWSNGAVGRGVVLRIQLEGNFSSQAGGKTLFAIHMTRGAAREGSGM